MTLAAVCVVFFFFFLFVMSFQPWRSSSEWNFWSLMLMMKDWVIIQVQHWSLESVVCSGLYLFWALFLEIKLPLTLFLSLLWRQTLTPKIWDMLPLLKWSPAWRPINLSDKSCVLSAGFISQWAEFTKRVDQNSSLQNRGLFQKEQHCSSVSIPARIFSRKITICLTYVNNISWNRFCQPFLGFASFIGLE